MSSLKTIKLQLTYLATLSGFDGYEMPTAQSICCHSEQYSIAVALNNSH